MTWKLLEHQYRWTADDAAGSLSFGVDEKQPLAGIHQVCQQGHSLPVSFFFQVIGLPIQDAAGADWTLRGNDLSLNLPYSQQRPTGAECSWRLQRHESRTQMEFWLSANTRLLDEQIQCTCRSELRCSQVQVLTLGAEGMVLASEELHPGQHRWENTDPEDPTTKREWAVLATLESRSESTGLQHLVIANYPGDQLSLSLEWKDGTLVVENEMNFGFLEKGVIRRTRLFAALYENVPGITTEVESGLNQFLHSPLPLTV